MEKQAQRKSKTTGRQTARRVRPTGTPQVIATLQHEHRYFESILDVLDEQAAKLASGECDFYLLQDVLHYMVSYPDVYHHPREDLIFERLLRADVTSQNAVQSLIDGHKEIYKHTNRLLKMIDRIVDGGSPNTDTLQTSLNRYASEHRKHIKTEDTIVFPAAVEMFTPHDWAAINSAARHNQDPLFGRAVKRRYHRLAENLYDRAELIQRRLAVAEIVGVESAIESLATLSSASWDIVSVVSGRIRQCWNDNLKSTQRRLGSMQPLTVLGLPAAILLNNYEQLSQGMKEIQSIAGRTVDDLKKPYNTRMDYLKELLRRDWGE